MNYFAHGREHLSRPYFLAGVAAPDWLNVVDRKVRARSRLAAPCVGDADPAVAEVAQGVMQHHADDDWFHQTRAFAELNLAFTVAIRDALPPDGGFRPSFLGHILVEILLDDLLITEQPDQLEAYYKAMESLDGAVVAAALNRMATRPVEEATFAWFLERFCQERFLYDYADDGKLLMRLNQVMRRVALPALPDTLTRCFADMRNQVADRREELLSPPCHPAG
ncbi:hypothetical protein [Lignipirellula cremea]|uniref:Uncharacterized protein n=1 Tax=Lignipirellula cremea TaxID=2528010 RepID=A0A518DU24_9BACT|nr:hypothetical protein [Lignipirellula cremea]QDU95342.1 hypothetical protein Pla8534_31570 [Lignipirellula cremea]